MNEYISTAQFARSKESVIEHQQLIEDCMKAHKVIANPTVDQILETENWTYERIRSRR